MISVNFVELNESLKTFILSVALGSEKVISSLLETANRHLDQLELLNVDTPNFKLHFDCSVEILTNSYTALVYINNHSADLFSDNHICPLDYDLKLIEDRFKLVSDRFKKLGVK